MSRPTRTLTKCWRNCAKQQAAPQLPAPVQNYGVTILKSPDHADAAGGALFAERHATTRRSWPITPTSILLTRSRGSRASPTSTFSAPANTPCAFGSSPDQLAKLNITVSDVIAAVNSQNTVNPAGQVGGPPSPPGQEFTYTAIAQGRLVTEKQFGEIVVRENPDGSVVRLKDVARIELGAPALQPRRPPQRRTRRRHGHLPVARLQRARRRQGRQGR